MAMTTLALVPDSGLHVRTIDIPHIQNLLQLLPADGGLAWVQGEPGNQDGAVGWGCIDRVEFDGPERFSRAQKWWSTWCEQSFGDSAIAFASFAFASEPGQSVLVVPEVIVRNSAGKSALTVIAPKNEIEYLVDQALSQIQNAQKRERDIGTVTWHEGSIPVSNWQANVDKAVVRINRGELDKVVLARDIFANLSRSLDVGELLVRLNNRFPDCWTFAVDGLVGATPELLVRRAGESVTSRILAGTVRRSSNLHRDDALAASLLDSDKDQAEHEYAVQSVQAALAPHCTDLTVPTEPFILQLANVQHLATDITGQLADNVSALVLAASLHPTAAVCGTPTERASALITELEGMSRNRYAGPVGWITTNGDGELGIALRCANIEDREQKTLRLFAGCGIVSGSTGVLEVAESNAKFSAMRDALTQ